MSAVPRSDADPFSSAFRENRDAELRALRELGPVVYLDRYDVFACARYEEVFGVLKDTESFRSGAGVGLRNIERQGHWRKPSILLENDPPHHTRVRSVLMKVLNPVNIRGLREDFTRAAGPLVSAALEKGEVDAIPELAQPFPLQVFPDAVGLDGGNRLNLLAYGRMVFDGMCPENDVFERAMGEAGHVVPWIEKQTQRDALRPGGLGAQLYEAADRGELSEEEAALLVRSFLSAGVDTTILALGTAMMCFATHRGQWRRIQEEPRLLRAAFEESIRLYSPFQIFFRTAVGERQISGTTVPDGAKVMVMPGSANRDPRRWERPDEFDLSRKSGGHIAFGYGSHSCVGQMIARLEAQVLLGEMLERVADFELTGDVSWQASNTLCGLSRLPLRLIAK